MDDFNDLLDHLRHLIDSFDPDTLPRWWTVVKDGVRGLHWLGKRAYTASQTPGVREPVILAAGAVGVALLYRLVSRQMQARATGTASLRRSVGRRMQANATGVPSLKFEVLGRDGRPRSNR